MQDSHKIRLHIEYRVLYAADFRRIVGAFENAYNILQKAEETGGRMRRADRLTVQTVRTENSVELWLQGALGLVNLATLIGSLQLMIRKSQKIKWETKNEKRDYEERIEKADTARISEVEAGLDRQNAKATKLMIKLIKFVDKSKEITSLQIEIDGQNPEPNKVDGPLEDGGRKLKTVL